MLKGWRRSAHISAVRNRRTGLALAVAAALAGCTVIPKGPPTAPPQFAPPPPTSALPADVSRHRVALLVPLAGVNAGAGQAIANAATMALLDSNAKNLRITTYDTSPGAPTAAARAVADGNQLILGPLLGADALAVAQTARAAHIPVISFSNDTQVAGGDVFVIGNIPDQAVARVVRYARAHGAQRFAGLVPIGPYGDRDAAALLGAVRASGGALVGMESYNRGAPTASTAIAAAVRRLKAHGPFDTVLIADTPRIAAFAAPLLARAGPVNILGTELWDGEALPTRTPLLVGARFASLPDANFRHFVESYAQRFGATPGRIATLGYDSVLLTLRVSRDWAPGTPFPTARLYDQGGFAGVDGAFRFGADDVVERALEVREVRPGAVAVVSPAPTRFGQ